ncbi:ectoine/hydroxyectoine ABC transporter permease subunit EhuD [Ornithinimicrobium sp. CNJ-824]|uniref:amino acid ABC transporter permease n=1 Tax=Ornithinimicrobium sp. CNJ-824 TaxID=1904966 RepID=UPI000967223E|nr:ABC transporter permease subunit [Ornithinimicrobium sp. CNJ-824]OLT23965.1 ectoine/hydroxyectoine ABC transporter permease subunit EhuD [Ornithinimicrobium sp. CNJ-824]
MFETELFLEALPILVMAFLEVTLVVTVTSSLLAAVLGLVWAIALRELPGALARPLAFVLDFIRMTPLPVHLLVIYYAFTQLSPMTVGILVFGVHYSTYMAESYRAGIESIRKGQWEAAKALSLPPARTWRAVILPQAIRNTLPSLGNWAIAMFKDTPFLIFISVPEMVTRAREFGGQNFSYIEAMTLAGLLFLLASYPTAVLMQKLEKKLAY